MKVQPVQGGQLFFWCPGCDEPHGIITSPGRWSWNGDTEKPTITPSVLTHGDIRSNGHRCHLFITDGQIRYLDDSTHKLAGQTIEMVDWPYGEPE